MIAALHGRPGRAVGPTEAQGEDAVDEAVATETASRSWALRVFDTVMRESRGDFKSYLRSEPPIFRVMVNRLTLRISKHQDCRHRISVPPLHGSRTGWAPYDFHRKLAETAR